MFTLMPGEARKSTMKIFSWKITLTALLTGLVIWAGVSAADPAFRREPGEIRIKDVQPGLVATADAGQIATIHIVGWIDEKGQHGREFFNSRKQRGLPVSFVIGTDQVMPAWNEGVLGMKAGGKRKS